MFAGCCAVVCVWGGLAMQRCVGGELSMWSCERSSGAVCPRQLCDSPCVWRACIFYFFFCESSLLRTNHSTLQRGMLHTALCVCDIFYIGLPGFP